MQEAEDAFLRELEIDPNSVFARYKLGVLNVERGDGAKAKELIEEAVRVKPGLLHADYNLGRAEQLLGNYAAAIRHFERATTAPRSAPEVVGQAWYQLGIIYRRLHRLDEAQKALAMFQKLKDAEAEESRQSLSKYKNKQSSEPSEPPPVPQNP